MDSLKVANRDTNGAQRTTEAPTKPQTPTQAAAPWAASRRVVSRWATFKREPGRLPPRPGTYAQVRAVQAQAHQPMDTLKVANHDTKAP